MSASFIAIFLRLELISCRQTEDWQGEKCDISLLEGTPAEYALHLLDDACLWLQTSSLSPADKSAILDRLLLRKVSVDILPRTTI